MNPVSFVGSARGARAAIRNCVEECQRGSREGARGMHLSPRSRALTKGKQPAEEFVESRLRHLGFPTFEGDEVQGDETDGCMTIEIGYPGLGEDSTESSAPLVAELVGMVGKEMSLGPGKVTVFMSSWNSSQATNLVSFVKNEKHIAAWLRDNSWAQVLHLARDESVIVRHKAVLVRVWTNLGLLHQHKLSPFSLSFLSGCPLCLLNDSFPLSLVSGIGWRASWRACCCADWCRTGRARCSCASLPTTGRDACGGLPCSTRTSSEPWPPSASPASLRARASEGRQAVLFLPLTNVDLLPPPHTCFFLSIFIRPTRQLLLMLGSISM